MRDSFGLKLAAVVGLLGFVAVGISAFAVRQSLWEQDRAAATDRIWNAGLQAGALGQAIEHAVVQAIALYTAEDTQEARTRLSGLQDALAAVEQVRVPFLAAMEDRLPPDRRRRFDLFVKEFIAYQTDTAELGLTISPKAALIPFTERQDAIGQMAHAIAAFQAAMIERRTLDHDARARTARDLVRAERLAAATQAFDAEMQRTVADLAASADAMQASADALSGLAGETTAQVAVVAEASDQTAGVVVSIASAAEELSVAAREIESQVRHTDEIASTALSDTQGLVATVTTLSQAADDAGAVIALIRAVAQQTNMLALNATIEAARAGAATDSRKVSDSVAGVRASAASNEVQAKHVRTSALQVNAGTHSLQRAIEAFLTQVAAA